MKLKTKIIIPILIVILMAIGALGSISYFQAKKIILNQIYMQAEDELKTASAILQQPNSNINELIHTMKIGKQGYGYIVDGSGKIILHPDEKSIGINLNDYDWGKTILKEQNGTLNYIYNGGERHTVYEKVQNKILVIAIPVKEFVGPLYTLKITIITVLAVSLLLAILAVFYLISMEVVKPINKLVEAMNKAGNGDLNTSVSFQTKDEMTMLGQTFNKMVLSIRELVVNVRETIIRLNENSGLIISSMDEIAASSEEVSKTTQEIASGADEQAQESSNTLCLTKDLVNVVNDSTEKLELVRLNTGVMMERNIESNSAVQDLSQRFKENSDAMKVVSSNVLELATKSRDVKEILNTIKSISSQTNLLALNAAIEAARAGEQGRGFAVVADEIRKLADQSARSTEEIQTIISDITEVIGRVDKTVSEAKGIEHKSNEALEVTKLAFQNIKEAVDNVVRQVDLLGKDIKLVGDVKEKVVNSVDVISSVSQQTAAATEEISASAEEQTASIEEINSSLQEVNNMIESLSKSIKLFRI